MLMKVNDPKLMLGVMMDGILLKLLYRQSRSAVNFHISFSKGLFRLRGGGEREYSRVN